MIRGDGKLARGIRGMRGSVSRFEAWAAASRDRSRPLVWFHAPSVGEGLQAHAVMEALRAEAPEVQLAYTYFSPSAEPFARRTPADVADYLPFDRPAPMARLFDTLLPDAVVFSKTEVWPNATRAAAARDIPSVLLSATLPEGSSRLRGPARALLAPAHRRLAHIGAISTDDADRFRSFKVDPARISVTGDARFDQVWRRTRAPQSDPRLINRLSSTEARMTIVAGSTWPPDEDRILEAYDAIGGAAAGIRLILVPHEPSEEHLTRAESKLMALGIDSIRLAEVERQGGSAAVLLVDRVGVLGDLYRLADIAYVGGAFGTDGIHSVLEPAAFGAPVVFGPRHQNAREAAELIARGGALSVGGSTDLASIIRTWAEDGDARREAGERARAYVEAGLGAAARGAQVVLDLIASRHQTG